MSTVRYAGASLVPALLALLAPGAAGAPRQALVENINQVPLSSSDSSPAAFVTTAGRLYFTADAAGLGRELYWVGAAGGPPTLLADLEPGPGSSYPGGLVELPGGTVLFTASNEGFLSRPHRSDGTAAGTISLTDPAGGELTDVPGFAVHQGSAYFFAQEATSGDVSLWKSDGTTAGTVPLESFAGLALLDSEWTALASSTGDLYFALKYQVGAGLRWRLYRTDGTPGAAVQLADQAAIDFGSIELAAAADRAVLAVETDQFGEEIWVSDGTVAGTQLVDSAPGPASGAPLYLTPFGADVYYAGLSPGGARELFKSDGTPAGTVQVTNGSYQVITDLYAGAGLLYFAGTEGVYGAEPWATTGAVGAEQLLADLFPGPGGSYPDALTELGGVLYCSATVSLEAGAELVAAGGGAPGVVIDLKVDGSSDPRWTAAFAGTLYFDADGTFVGRELWSTDGSAAGTQLVADLAPTGADLGSHPEGLVRIGDRALFVAQDGSSASAVPYTSDGTAAGTAAVDPAFTASFDSAYAGAPFEDVTLGARAFFTPEDEAAGIELWVSDGSAAGTQLLADLWPGAASSLPSPLAVWRGELYFSADSPALGRELYATDGTPAGTRLVLDIEAGPAGSAPLGAAVHGNHLYFRATTAGEGSELWRTDGTAAGTQIVADLRPGPGSGLPLFSAASFGGWLYFNGQTAPAQGELWRTDGTAAGTSLFADLNGADGSAPTGLVVGGGALFFNAYELPERQLYATDGTSVVQLTSAPHQFAGFDDEPIGTDAGAVAILRKGANENALIASDGTPAGTSEVAVIQPETDVVGLPITWRASSGPHVLFMAWEAATGDELWVTDGTAAGTQRLTDVVPGSADAEIDHLTRVGDRLLFGARDEVLGVELFSLPIASYGGWVAEPFGLGCAGSSGFAPQIDAAGSATLGGAFDVVLSGAVPSSLASHYVSPGFAATPLGGCELYLANPSLLATTATDGFGATNLPLVVPNDPALAGARFWLQSAVLDLGGALLGVASLSPALEVVVGS